MGYTLVEKICQKLSKLSRFGQICQHLLTKRNTVCCKWRILTFVHKKSIKVFSKNGNIFLPQTFNVNKKFKNGEEKYPLMLAQGFKDVCSSGMDGLMILTKHGFLF